MRTLLLLSVAALAACGPVNRTVQTAKAPEIVTTQLSYDVRFDGGVTLNPRAARALEEYLASIDVGYGDRVSLDDPVAAGASARRAAIAGVLARFGLFLEEGSPITAGGLSAGMARVVVARSRAEVAPCPDWRRASNPEYSASTMSNYGCANRGNLAAMLADPNDLVTARQYEGAEALAAVKPVRTLRDRVAKPPEWLEGLSVTRANR